MDEIDVATNNIERDMDIKLAEQRRLAAAIPKGDWGECGFCGGHFSRVVPVIDPKTDETVCSCGRCRDQRGIK